MNINKQDLNHPSCYEQLEPREKEVLDKWVRRKFEKSKRTYTDRSSYGLKHDFKRETGIYVYNGAFKGAMIEAGFEAKDETKLNWHFKVKERIPDSFWGFCIKQYKYNDSPLGDLAKDMKIAPGFPRESNDKAEILDYLHSRYACKEAVKAFEKAWKYYEKKRLSEKSII